MLCHRGILIFEINFLYSRAEVTFQGMINDESTARPTYADAKTGGSLHIAPPLQRGDYTVDSNGRATFVRGNRGKVAKAIQVNAREFIIKCCNGEAGVKKLIEKIYAQALKGQFRAQELLLNYILGRPTERIKIENADKEGISYSPVVRIIADHLRLEKLERDAAAAPSVVEEQRVEEMEKVLNNAIAIAPEVPTVEEESAPKQKFNGTATRKHKSKKVTPKKRKKK